MHTTDRVPRTIVVSDLHGSASILERALADARFAETDRLVIAGDLLDGGHDDTVALAESLGATILAGNHEVSAALGIVIAPQDESTRRRAAELRERFTSGEWPLAAEADGWLITHAGVSVALDDLVRHAHGDAAALAGLLNARFAEEIADAARARRLGWADLERYALVGGALGPLWFRPHDLDLLPRGLRQIVGHTAAEYLGAPLVHRLEAAGWLLVEPGGHRGAGPAFRYAVVAGGQAHVVSRTG